MIQVIVTQPAVRQLPLRWQQPAQVHRQLGRLRMCVCLCVYKCVREGDVCNTGICVHACCSLCDRDRGKGDLGAGEDTGVSELVGAWEKSGKRVEGKELWPGGQTDLWPFSSSGQSQCAICVSMSSHCLDICPSFRNPTWILASLIESRHEIIARNTKWV